MLKLRDHVDRILGWIVSVVMGVLVIDVLWQVFTRFILADPSSYTEELARYLMIWVGLLGAAYAAGKRMHLAVDLLPMKVKGRNKARLGIVIDSFAILFAVAIMIVGGSRLVWVMLYLGQTSPALQIPTGIVYLALPISGVFITFYSVCFIIEHVRALRDPSGAAEDARADIGSHPRTEVL
jgi:TRAP-type C4-dicarboxylate transport system permease small subunit